MRYCGVSLTTDIWAVRPLNPNSMRFIRSIVAVPFFGAGLPLAAKRKPDSPPKRRRTILLRDSLTSSCPGAEEIPREIAKAVETLALRVVNDRVSDRCPSVETGVVSTTQQVLASSRRDSRI